MSLDSVVINVTSYGLDDQGLICSKGRIFSFVITSRWALGL